MFEDKVDILCQNLWKVFGPNLGSVLDTVNRGASKQEVLEQIEDVIAVKDVSCEVANLGEELLRREKIYKTLRSF